MPFQNSIRSLIPSERQSTRDVVTMWALWIQQQHFYTRSWGRLKVCTTDKRVQIEWQWPLSGIHYIMMVNSAQHGENGGYTPSPFHSSKVVVYAAAERADTLPLILLCPFLLCGLHIINRTLVLAVHKIIYLWLCTLYVYSGRNRPSNPFIFAEAEKPSLCMGI